MYEDLYGILNIVSKRNVNDKNVILESPESFNQPNRLKHFLLHCVLNVSDPCDFLNESICQLSLEIIEEQIIPNEAPITIFPSLSENIVSPEVEFNVGFWMCNL